MSSAGTHRRHTCDVQEVQARKYVAVTRASSSQLIANTHEATRNPESVCEPKLFDRRPKPKLKPKYTEILPKHLPLGQIFGSGSEMHRNDRCF